MDEAHLMLLLLKALSALEVRGSLGFGGTPFKRCACSMVNLSALTSHITLAMNICNYIQVLLPHQAVPLCSSFT